jgi:hypothetical protein
MTPILQTAHDLRLNLIEGPIRKWSQFNILKVEEKAMGPWRIKAHVIGASHLISVRYKHVRFHEILACLKVKAPTGRICCSPLMHTGSLSHRFPDRIEYRFDSKILKWSAGQPIILKLEQMLPADGDRQFGIMAEYSPVRTGTTPKTIILIKMTSQALKFETVHSYPNEDCIVLSETSIKEAL